VDKRVARVANRKAKILSKSDKERRIRRRRDAARRSFLLDPSGKTSSRGGLSNREVNVNENLSGIMRKGRKKSTRNQIIDRAIKDSIEATEDPNRRK